MQVYLYVKQHSLTKLKYFGKTTRDPYNYNGSGLYWKRHLKKYGPQVDTLDVWEFNDINKCELFALNFSHTNNIVESNEWGNLKLENGRDGGFFGKHTEEAKIKMKLPRKNNGNTGKYWLGKQLTEEHKQKIAIKSSLHKHSFETKRKISLAHIGKSKPNKLKGSAQPKKICPFCGTDKYTAGNLKRHHILKCTENI